MTKRSSELQALLDEFRLYARNPERGAQQWKAENRGKVVGCIGLDIPEPLIHAAGMLPIVILDRDEEVTLGNAHVETHMCGYIRSVVDQALKGELSYCDEIVAHDCCHIVRMMGDALHTFCDKVKKLEFVYFSPLLHNPIAQDFTKDEMARLRSRLEKMSGSTITDEALSNSIKVYNRQKALLEELYAVRRNCPGILTGVEVSDIVSAGMCMDKLAHIAMVEKLLPMLTEDLEPVVKGIPVLVHGSLCERCDDYVLENIEKCGGVIVDDDLYVGSRYFGTAYDETVDPMEALLKAYTDRVSPCPTRYEDRNLGDFLENRMKESGAQAAVMVVVKFCEAHDFAYFSAYRRFCEKGIRNMLVETEHGSTPEGQLRTRLQGFFESMEV